ncbi:hypothetical protein Tco_0032561 [Tanacetum coccineum]
MENPNITMEEYIRLEEEKAQSHGETFNWQNAKFGRIGHYYKEECFTNFDEEFPAIFFGNTNTALFDTKQGMIMGEYDAEKEDSEIGFPAIVLNDTSPSYEPPPNHAYFARVFEKPKPTRKIANRSGKILQHNLMEEDWGNKFKKRDQTIDWFGYEMTFEKEFEEFCKNNSKSNNDNDMDDDYWANYNPHDEWMHMKSEETNPTKIFQEKIMDHKLVITNDELMHYARDRKAWAHKISRRLQRMTRKFDEELDEWIKINVTCEDEAKRRNSGAKTKTLEENCYLLLYGVSSKEDTAYPAKKIWRISASSSHETRNDQFPIWRIHYSPIRRMHSWKPFDEIMMATPDLNGTHTTPCLANPNLAETKTKFKIEISKEMLMMLHNNAYNGDEAIIK